eukprot:scaffold11459_cov68-Cyclotella_meneghiniana.AAC.1
MACRDHSRGIDFGGRAVCGIGTAGSAHDVSHHGTTDGLLAHLRSIGEYCRRRRGVVRSHHGSK